MSYKTDKESNKKDLLKVITKKGPLRFKDLVERNFTDLFREEAEESAEEEKVGLNLSGPTLSKHLKKLEEEGEITTINDPNDRRSKLYEKKYSAKGRKKDFIKSLDSVLENPISEEKQEEITELLSENIIDVCKEIKKKIANFDKIIGFEALEVSEEKELQPFDPFRITWFYQTERKILDKVLTKEKFKKLSSLAKDSDLKRRMQQQSQLKKALENVREDFSQNFVAKPMIEKTDEHEDFEELLSIINELAERDKNLLGKKNLIEHEYLASQMLPLLLKYSNIRKLFKLRQ